MAGAGGAVAAATWAAGWRAFAAMPIGVALIVLIGGGRDGAATLAGAFSLATGLAAGLLLLVGPGSWRHALVVLFGLGLLGGLQLALGALRRRQVEPAL